MDDSLRELYQGIILDHSRHPRHFGPLSGANQIAEGFNPLCGDRVKIYMRLGKDGHIDGVGFEGKGCAISQASASLMSELLQGRTMAEAETLMGGFLHMVKGEDTSGLDAQAREQLEVLAGVSAFPMRVKCATLAWHAMKSALHGGKTLKSE